MSMQGSAMMYVTRASVAAWPDAAYGVSIASEPVSSCDEFRGSLDERRLHDDLIEAGRMSALEAGFVRVVRVSEDRDVGPRVDDLLGLHTRDVRDHEVWRVDAVARHQPVRREQPLEFPAEEEVDPDEQDRGHDATVAPLADTDNRMP